MLFMYLSHVPKFVFFRHIPDYWYCIYCYDWICAFWETTPTCGSYCICCLFYDFLSFCQWKGNTIYVCLCAFSSSLVSNGTMSRLSKLIIFILYLYFILCISYSINIHVFHDDTDFSVKLKCSALSAKTWKQLTHWSQLINGLAMPSW